MLPSFLIHVILNLLPVSRVDTHILKQIYPNQLSSSGVEISYILSFSHELVSQPAWRYLCLIDMGKIKLSCQCYLHNVHGTWKSSCTLYFTAQAKLTKQRTKGRPQCRCTVALHHILFTYIPSHMQHLEYMDFNNIDIVVSAYNKNVNPYKTIIWFFISSIFQFHD